MNDRKISSNLAYNLLMQIAGFITPLITSPYIARVLSPELIGDYSFVLANSNYFTLLECLGLTLYGMIEVAKVRDDKKKRSELFWEIMLIKMVLTTVCVLLFWIMFVYFGNEKLKQLYLVMILNLLAVGIDTTWFLSGLEEFKITAIRSIVVRIISVILILLFVKGEHDIVKYAVIMQGSTFVSYAVMFPTSMKRTICIPLRKLHIGKHIKSSLTYFVPGIINTVFSSTDKSILGFFSTSYEVGVYEQAHKICQLFAGMISAISNTILPRAAYLNSNLNKKQEAERLFRTSIKICLFASLPICYGTSAIADNFIPVFFGSGYEKSAILLKILCVNMFFVAVSNFYGQQVLMAKGRQKEYNIAVATGAFANVAINLMLVYPFESVGVSFASAISGLISFLMISHYGRDAMPLSAAIKMLTKYLIAAVIMYCCIFKIYVCSDWLTVLIQITTGVVAYIAILFVLRDDLIYFVLKRMQKK